jgi:hypothetical protein
MTHSPTPIASRPPRNRHSARMRRHRTIRAAMATVAVVVSLPASTALAAAGVVRAQGATRTALVRAFIVQDGTSRGISGVYVSGAAGVVCQRTPDAGLVRFVFRHTRGSWRFALSTRGSLQGTLTQRRLEHACH